LHHTLQTLSSPHYFFLTHSASHIGTSPSGSLGSVVLCSIMVNHSTSVTLVNLSLVHTGQFHCLLSFCLLFTLQYHPHHLKYIQSSSS